MLEFVSRWSFSPRQEAIKAMKDGFGGGSDPPQTVLRSIFFGVGGGGQSAHS